MRKHTSTMISTVSQSISKLREKRNGEAVQKLPLFFVDTEDENVILNLKLIC